MLRCTRCVLPETFPGICFDAEGVCNYCRRALSAEQREARRARLRRRFEELVEEVHGHGDYECLMSWSGGKDSTYTLALLKEEFGLRVLAFTFDNGFVSPRAFQNMRKVGETLGVDHIILKPRFDLLRRIFVASMQPDFYSVKARERASNICTSCMSLAKGMGLRLALERNIPLLAYGWSPGQLPLSSALFRLTPSMARAMIQAATAPLRSVVGDALAPYFPTEETLTRPLPYNVSPLAFLTYDEAQIYRRIRELGWEAPEDTDPNSTNCLLNVLANEVHQAQAGYHPYVLELAQLVREGYLSREKALRRLSEPPDKELLHRAKAKLGGGEELENCQHPLSAPDPSRR